MIVDVYIVWNMCTLCGNSTFCVDIWQRWYVGELENLVAKNIGEKAKSVSGKLWILSCHRQKLVLFQITGCSYLSRYSALNWQHSLVVRSSVIGRRTFPALRPIYGWQVTTLWVNCPLWVSQAGQLTFHPSGVCKVVVIHVFAWIMRVETIKTADRVTFGCMAAGKSVWARAWAMA